MRLRVLKEFSYSFTGLDCTRCKIGSEYDFSESFSRYALENGLVERTHSKVVLKSPEDKAVRAAPKRRRRRHGL